MVILPWSKQSPPFCYAGIVLESAAPKEESGPDQPELKKKAEVRYHVKH